MFKPSKRLLAEGKRYFHTNPRKRFMTWRKMVLFTGLFVGFTHYQKTKSTTIFMKRLKERDESLNNKLISFTQDLSLSSEEFLVDFQTFTPFSLQNISQIIEEQHIVNNNNQVQPIDDRYIIIMKGGDDFYGFMRTYREINSLLKQYNLAFLGIFDKHILEENQKMIQDLKIENVVLSYIEPDKLYQLEDLQDDSLYCLDQVNNTCIFQTKLNYQDEFVNLLQIRLNKEIEKDFVKSFNF